MCPTPRRADRGRVGTTVPGPDKEKTMSCRRTVATLLVAGALAVPTAAAQASQPRDHYSPTAPSLGTALLTQLRHEYAVTHARGVHNEIVLLVHHASSGVL